MKKFGNKDQRILDVDDESFSVSLRFKDGAGGVKVHLENQNVPVEPLIPR